MKRLVAVIFLCQLSCICFCQRKFSRIPVEYYADNIIKVTLKPSGVWHNENVSDAVMLKPIYKRDVKLLDNEEEPVILVADRITISSFDSADYRGFRFRLQPNEKVFGGGERALPLNRRGYRLPLYNNPWYGYSEGADALNYSVPFITSSKGYGLFFDNPSKGFIDIGKTNADVLTYGASSGEINVYIIFGDYKTILQSYHKLTGTQPLPPRWALGNLMSRFGYTSEAQVKDIYSKMKAEGMPVDAVIFDLFWFGDSIKHTMGNLDWVNRKAWPDPKQMIADFKKESVQTILVTEPFFVETSKNYTASKPYLAVDSKNKPYYLNDFYFGNGGLIDIFRNDAQSWFWQFYKKQMQMGVEAWWGDLGEPEKHPSNMYHNLKDLGQKRLFAADEVHNLYGHTWTKMLYKFYAKEYPNKRLFSLNRSGFAGTQRFSIFPWTGDVSRSWSGFRAQLPILLGMSMSGVPYVHSDAGGFAGGEGDPELYVRWLQMAAFTPIFRPHGTALFEKDTAAFSFPSEAALMTEPYKKYAKEAILGRYSMLPYTYSLAYQQTISGKPLIAPLYYHFPQDTTAAKIQDQFMWGDSYLVAPVLGKGATTRSYYLPAGRWYHNLKKRFINGSSWQTDSVGLDRIPVLMKEGSFVPADGRVLEQGNTQAYNSNEIAMLYYPAQHPSSFDLFIDDGLLKNSIKKGDYELLHFSSTGTKNKRLSFAITSKQKSTKPVSIKRKILFHIIELETPTSISINEKKYAADKNGRFNFGKEVIAVKDGNDFILMLPYFSKPVSIVFKFP